MNIFKLRTAHCGIQQTTFGFRPKDFEPGNPWDKNTKEQTVQIVQIDKPIIVKLEKDQTVQIDKPIEKGPSYHQFMLTLSGLNAIMLATNIVLLIKK